MTPVLRALAIQPLLSCEGPPNLSNSTEGANTEAEFHQMGNMTVDEMDAALAKRRIKMTRGDWLRESVPYSYFWKQVAHAAMVPSCGVFLACTWVGWMERRIRGGVKTAA
jgi:hypothetical protein